MKGYTDNKMRRIFYGKKWTLSEVSTGDIVVLKGGEFINRKQAKKVGKLLTYFAKTGQLPVPAPQEEPR